MKIKTLLLFLIALAIMVALGACSSEELMQDVKPHATPQDEGRALLLTAAMPGEDPATRVGLTQEADKSITLTWEADDELQLVFVQGAIKATNTAKIASLSEDKKKATFKIFIPSGVNLREVFNLYGVYGSGTIDISGTNPVVTLPANAGSATSLTDVQTRKDVMLSFTNTDIDITQGNLYTVFNHLGSLFSITLKNTGTESLDNLQEAQIVGIDNANNLNWAYNTATGGQLYDLVAGQFLNPASAGNYISFAAAQNNIPAESTITFWAWYPPLPGKTWPKLQLQLKDATPTPIATGTNALPARTSETAAAKSYYFYAAWDGSELNFTDESFSNELTIDVAEMGTLSTLLSATQKTMVTKLTVTGQINKADYDVMKSEMPSLVYVDLSKVKSYEGITPNKIPNGAFGDVQKEASNKKIKTVVLPENITIIGSYAFSGCTDLSGNLIIPSKVTTIEVSAFFGCSGLDGTLTLSEELVTIADYAFRDCVNISGNLIIPNKVTTIAGSAFYNCSSFKGTLTLSEELITIGSYAFSYTGFIGDLTIPNKVTTIEGGAFYSCKGFNGHLTLPNNITTIKPSTFDNCEGFIGDLAIPSKVTTIALRAFAECKGFNGRLTLPDKLVSIGERAFISCAGLKGDFRMPSTVNSIGNFAFFGCQSITAFEFPHPNLTYSFKMLWSSRDDIGTTPVRVPGNAIDTYKAAEGWKDHLIEELFDEHSVDVPTKGVLGTLLSATQKTITTKLTLTGEINKADYDVMKNEMPNLSVVDLRQVTSYEGETLNKIPDEAFGSQYFDEANQSISTIIFPESVTNIGSSAFQNCRGLKGNLILPATLITIGDFAFYSCTGFTGSLTIPDKVTTIGNDSFKFCIGITSLTLSEGLETIGSGAFYGCDQIIGSIIYPSSLTSIGENGFNNCHSVTAFQFLRTTPIAYTDVMLEYEIPVKVPSPAAVTAYQSAWGANADRHTITAAFDGQTIDVSTMGSLSTLLSTSDKATISKLKLTGKINKDDFNVMRNDMPNLRVVDLSLVTSYDGETANKIPNYAFGGDDNPNKTIKSIILPLNTTSIGTQAFKKCTGLTGKLIIPDKVTEIGHDAFSECVNLSGSLIIPNSVTWIGSNVFRNCKGFDSLTMSQSIKSMGWGPFYNCSGLKGTVKFPQSLVFIEGSAFFGCNNIDGFQFHNTTPIPCESQMLPSGKPVQVPASAVSAYTTAWGTSRHTITGF